MPLILRNRDFFLYLAVPPSEIDRKRKVLDGATKLKKKSIEEEKKRKKLGFTIWHFSLFLLICMACARAVDWNFACSSALRIKINKVGKRSEDVKPAPEFFFPDSSKFLVLPRRKRWRFHFRRIMVVAVMFILPAAYSTKRCFYTRIFGFKY